MLLSSLATASQRMSYLGWMEKGCPQVRQPRWLRFNNWTCTRTKAWINDSWLGRPWGFGMQPLYLGCRCLRVVGNDASCWTPKIRGLKHGGNLADELQSLMSRPWNFKKAWATRASARFFHTPHLLIYFEGMDHKLQDTGGRLGFCSRTIRLLQCCFNKTHRLGASCESHGFWKFKWQGWSQC